ncbi:MAG: ABC transporter permease [Clostridia bacterium]|nr:ABC transporter permease [Clostridia bacterium]
MTLLLLGSVQLGLIYALMAMGNYVSFRILNIPDLTVDGSFALGMAVSVMTAASGHPYLALLFAVLAGACAGLCTGLLQTKAGINPILSGILTMTALYSVNLFVMGGKANQSLFGFDTVFTFYEKLGLSKAMARTIPPFIIVVLVAAVLSVFFKTRAGMAIRATGDNEEMVRSSSINANFAKCVGFALANSCIALAGGLVCQYNQSADTGYGSGMLVVGLASVIIGEAVLGHGGVTRGLISVAVGAVLYQIIIAIALKVNLLPAYGLKFVSALIVGIALAMPTVKAAIARQTKKKNAKGGK